MASDPARDEMKALVAELAAAHRELGILMSDRDEPAVLGAPCTAAGILGLEADLGRLLPPSYRAFLELHNGWDEFDGDGKILAVEDQAADWVKEKIQTIDTLFAESDAKSPFEQGAIPVIMGESTTNYVVLEPAHAHPNGEMAFQSYDLTEPEDLFPDFFAVLRDDLATTKLCIRNHKLGVLADDEADDDDTAGA